MGSNRKNSKKLFGHQSMIIAIGEGIGMDGDNSYLLNSGIIEQEKDPNHTVININENSNSPPDELIDFNISGTLFKTTAKTLEKFPNSLLGTKERRDKLLRLKTGEIFFDRNSAVFESVLTFYQTGILEQPPRVNPVIFVKDIRFYGLCTEAMNCGIKGFDIKCTSNPDPKRKWQAYLWKVLEYPDSSLAARIASMFSLCIIVLSIIIFCWETVPSYNEQITKLEPDKKLTIDALRNVEVFCISYFTIELIARFLLSPSKCKFLKDLLNIIDFVSILPFYLTRLSNIDETISIYFLRAIRLVRVFRIFKLSRHSNEMKILGVAVKDSVRELCVLSFFILLGVLLFSSAIYYVEGINMNSKITSIPGAFWWSIVTMTTVGYGDEVPVSIAGRIVGAICAMTGILVISMPIPIIVNNFTRHYQRLKPVPKYFEEFSMKEKQNVHILRNVIGLYTLQDLKENKEKENNDTLFDNNNEINSRDMNVAIEGDEKEDENIRKKSAESVF